MKNIIFKSILRSLIANKEFNAILAVFINDSASYKLLCEAIEHYIGFNYKFSTNVRISYINQVPVLDIIIAESITIDCAISFKLSLFIKDFTSTGIRNMILEYITNNK